MALQAQTLQAHRERLCKLCTTVDFSKFPDLKMQHGESYEKAKWDYIHVRNNCLKCNMCSLLSDILDRSLDGDSPIDTSRAFVFAQPATDRLGSSYHELEVSLTGPKKSWKGNRYCVRREKSMQRYQREAVDPIVIQNWISDCDKRHYQKHPSAEWTRLEGLELRLVDVNSYSIVDYQRGCGYAALSYVWGGIDQLSLTTQTISALQQPGGLLNCVPSCSRTIKHAISVCRSIGIRFLWVDTLCIIQDGEDLEKQINNMDAIYACAHLTIVAAYGNSANCGLPGSDQGVARKPIQARYEVGRHTIMTGLRSVVSEVRDSVWATRAWTFQEEVFSTRLLVFTDEMCALLCPDAIYREDGVYESNISHSRFPIALLNRLSTGDEMESYFRLVSFYIKRKLSREEDILRAFSGVMNALAPILGEFCWGLPYNNFIAALTWHYDSGSGLHRRDGFPSWSWAGWTHSNNASIQHYSLGSDPGYPFCEDFAPVIRSITRTRHPAQGIRCYRVNGDVKLETFAKFGKYNMDILISAPDESEWENVPNLRSLKVPHSMLLFFWTMTIGLAVMLDIFRIYDPIGHGRARQLCGGLRLDFGAQGQQHLNYELECALIAHTTYDSDGGGCRIIGLIVHWKDGIAYRAGVAEIRHRSDWIARETIAKLIVSSTRKLIILG